MPYDTATIAKASTKHRRKHGIVVLPAHFEFVQRPQALGLAHLAMNRDGSKAQVAQHESDTASIVACPCEQHDGAACQLS